MNNVDLIIKYLSKEMNPEESGSFEQKLSSDPELREVYEDVSAAYRLIEDQIRLMDEAAFRSRLREVMENTRVNTKHRTIRRPMWYFLLPLAGSLAILLTVFMLNRGSDRIFSQFFFPEKDPVVLAFSQETRGGSGPGTGAELYQRGFYAESRNKTSAILEAEPDNHQAMLFFLLASIKLDMEDEALALLGNPELNTSHRLGQSVTWYTSLALVKADRFEEAAIQLQSLEQQPGPYEAEARRLKKMLLK